MHRAMVMQISAGLSFFHRSGRQSQPVGLNLGRIGLDDSVRQVQAQGWISGP
jgi:hypothetical protein